MKVRTIAVPVTLIATFIILLQPCKASSFFNMYLEHDSIYTPAKMSMSMKLTNKAKIQGDYSFTVKIYIAGALVRKETLAGFGEKDAVFEFEFPQVRSRTDARCCAELFISEDFIEAKEKALNLWPPLISYPKDFMAKKVVWLFDTSGRLQKMFEKLGIEAADATFQAVRTFGVPDIVFIGQCLEPNDMRVITRSLKLVDTKVVTVFLRQKWLLENTEIEIPKENNHSERVVCDINSPLLEGLNKLDVMYMVDNAIYIKVKKQKDKDQSIVSCVTEVVDDKKNIYSYLLTIEGQGRFTIYCQLPVTDGQAPRYDVLLNNLLKYADKISDY